MQLSNVPAKIPLPFANAGAKNTIPEASQIGITAGAASLTDGFPPLTRTPLVSGGVPPSGLDMNGILFELSAIVRWANAGGGYPYDSTFVNDANVGGYPKGARIARSDGMGYWLNTVDNNVTDPEGALADAVAAGWVPDYSNGATAVTMTNANVTLTAAQYSKPVIVISGLLTGNLNLVFPDSVVYQWIVINNTTGAFSITCKTASGTGAIVKSVRKIVSDGTNIYAAIDLNAAMSALIASAGGTADALTATFSPVPTSWPNGVPFMVRAASANATTTPTVSVNGLTAKTIVKGNNLPLTAGDIAGAGHWLVLQYDTSLDKVVLQNPAGGVTCFSAAAINSGTNTTDASSTTTGALITAGGLGVAKKSYFGDIMRIGTTAAQGAIGNTVEFYAGIIKTVSGSTAAANNTATTLVTLPSVGAGCFLVSAGFSGINLPGTYSAVSIVTTDGANASITALKTTTGMALSLSGMNVQGTQTNGGTLNITWSVIRLS